MGLAITLPLRRPGLPPQSSIGGYGGLGTLALRPTLSDGVLLSVAYFVFVCDYEVYQAF